MTLDDTKQLLIKHSSWDVRQDGDDLVVSDTGSWSWADLKRLATILGTEQIDLLGRDEFSTLPGMTTIAGRYEAIGGGCATCGHGDEVVVRGLLKVAEPARA